MMKVKFKADQEFCFDGINTRKYKAGEVYEPTHAHEGRIFESFVDDGRAEIVDKKDAEPVEKQKVAKPKAKKTKAKKK